MADHTPTLELLPPDLAAKVHRIAGPLATARLERTSTRVQASVVDATWKAHGDDVWAAPPFSTATKSQDGFRAPYGATRPSPEPVDHKSALRASLADAILPEELTGRVWYHTWTGMGSNCTGATSRYRLAHAVPGLSTRAVIRTVRFHADGTMSWDGVHKPGSAWKYVERADMMGRFTRPATVLQFKHLAPLESGPENGDAAPLAEFVFPALRAYRVARGPNWASDEGNAGWVLSSQHDTFTSFRREGDAAAPLCAGEEEDEEPGVPTFMWRLDELRREVPRQDRSGPQEDAGDTDWLDAESDAFVADYRRVLRGQPSRLTFGSVLGNHFARM